MMQSTDEEMSPLTIPSSSPASPRHVRNRSCFRWRGMVYCTLIAGAVTLSICFFVDKEAVLGLRDRSSSYIRKKMDQVLSSSSSSDEQSASIGYTTTETEKPVSGTNDTKEEMENTMEDLEPPPEVDKNETGDDSNVVSDEKNATSENTKSPSKKDENSTPTVVIEENGKTNNAATSVAVEPAPSILDKRPNLVLHVGPQKTASSTLQDAWHKPQGLLSLLRADNYRYEFINPHRGFFQCQVYGGGFHDCVASKKLKDVLVSAAHNQKNLLLSDENLDGVYAETLRDVIDDNQFKVSVVVVYRRIHEWLVSWYNQINKSTNKDVHGNILLDHNGNPYREEHTHWPDQGGVKVPTFSQWYQDYTKYWKPSELVANHHSISFMNAYKPLFENIVVYNMHQDGDLVKNFMCDVVPDAQHCCDRLKNGALNIPRVNGSVKLDHDILAVEARERGLLMGTLSRREVVYSIGKHVENENLVLPRRCNMDVIDEIRTWLVESEEYIFKDSWSEEQTTSLGGVFDSYQATGKLCDVDIEAVFSDKKWTLFFRHLDNRPHLTLHVGPQKTGSSTLQEVWHAPKELLELLKQDNFQYERMNPHRGIFNCNIEEGRYTTCKATDMLVNLLADASKKHQNLLLSDENLDERFTQTLAEVIDESKFHIKVVVVYRRIHEWLVSWYNQINKSTNKDADGNFLKDENGQPIREKHHLWPAEGGVHVPSFTTWYREFVRELGPSSDLVNQHPSIHFMNVWKKVYPDNIAIYNMHQDGDLVTNFMCQMMPEAKKSCEALQEGLDLPLKNPSVKIEHDIIAVAAYERGLIETSVSRQEAMEQVTKYVKEAGKTLPRICDERVESEIRDWLLQSEKVMMQQTNEVDLADVFSSYQANGKLCDIDVESIIRDNDWIDFFRTMGLAQAESTVVVASQNTHKPHLVLHVGPQKSGSSTLQSAWDIMWRELDEDEYNYRHITPEQSDFNCSVNRFGGYTDCTASNQLKKLIVDTNQAGRNLLLTDENLDERFVGPLRDAIKDDEWTVTVVVVYRRIHEWIVSWYNQINKTTNRDSSGKILIDSDGNPYRKDHKDWPDEGGVHVPPFSAWFTDFTRNWDPSEFVGKHRSIEFYNLYDTVFDNVVIYNLHEHMEENMVKDFMCDVVPKADHSCVKLQQQQIDLPKVNPSVNLDHDILAVYAHEQGYLDKGVSRQDAVSAIGDYIKRTDKVIPRKCHPDITKQIYDWLIDSEREMFPDKWTPRKIAELNDVYQAYFMKGKLCDVDVEEAMKDQDWCEFFESRRA